MSLTPRPVPTLTLTSIKSLNIFRSANARFPERAHLGKASIPAFPFQWWFWPFIEDNRLYVIRAGGLFHVRFAMSVANH